MAHHYFCRLYVLATQANQYVILYGYGTRVNQQTRGWKRINLKHGMYMFEAVLSLSQLAMLQDGLEKDSFTLCISNKNYDITAGLVKRPAVILPPRDGYGAPSLVSEAAIVTGYWTLDKEILLGRLLPDETTKGEIVSKISKVLDQLSEEVGLDFQGTASNRVGNVDFYSFEGMVNDRQIGIFVDKTKEGKSLKVQKLCELDFVPLVRCRLSNGKECILDQLKPFEEGILTFETEEPIGHIQIEMWNQSNNQLCFMKNVSILRKIGIDMMLGGRGYTVKDEWTKRLKQSQSNLATHIKGNIEKVRPFSPASPSTVRDADPWLDASNGGWYIQRILGSSKPKGAFCKKVSDNLTAEIDSFHVIRNYMNQSDVSRVILVDPFFSILSAKKFLTRIENREVDIEILMSFTGKDPDKDDGTKAPEGYLDDIKNHLQQRGPLYPPNLTIVNILSGTSAQAFHDRFMLRTFRDGSSDGFLLSNSLNSAGTSYHFVVAPIESAIVQSLQDYVDDLRDPSQYSQEKIYPSAQEIVHESQDDFEPLLCLSLLVGSSEDVLGRSKSMNLVTDDSTFDHVEFDIPNATKRFWQLYTERGAEILLQFSRWLYHTTSNMSQVISVIQTIGVDRETLQDDIIKIAKRATIVASEKTLSDPNDEQAVLQKMLLGDAELRNAIGFAEAIFLNFPFVNGGDKIILYRLAIELCQGAYIDLLDETRDVLAYYSLAELMCYQWEPYLYAKAVSSQTPSVKELAFVWASRFITHSTDYGRGEFKQTDEIDKVLELLSPQQSILQLAHILAELRHGTLVRGKDNVSVREHCLHRLVALLANCDSELIEKSDFLGLFRGRLLSESSEDVVELAYLIEKDNRKLAEYLLFYLMTELKERLESDDARYLPADRVLTNSVAKAFVGLYQRDKLYANVEKLFVMKWFFEFNTPFLRDRDYTKWDTCGTKSLWILQLTSYVSEHCGERIVSKQLAQHALKHFNLFIADNLAYWPDHRHFIPEFIVYIGLWGNRGWIAVDDIRMLLKLDSVPTWIRLLLISLVDQFYRHDHDVLCSGLAQYTMRPEESGISRFTLAEAVIYRLIRETDTVYQGKLRRALAQFLSIAMEDYPKQKAYYEKLSMELRLENTQIQRGFVIPLIENELQQVGDEPNHVDQPDSSRISR